MKAIKLVPELPVLSIVHKASNTPFYCVEEADMGARKVSVSYFDENQPDSEIETKDIPTKDLIDFTNEFYRDYVDGWDQESSIHIQEKLEKAGIEYLTENLKAVCTDYLNQM